MRALPIALALLASACPAPAPTTPKPPPPPPPVVTPPPPPPPVVVDAPQPTLRLPKTFVPASYKARLAIDPKKPTFDGAITITGKLDSKSLVIWLHARKLDIKHAAAGTIALAATPKGEDLLELRADQPIDAGPVELTLEYTGHFDEVNTTGAFAETSGGQRYVFTQFEAIYARRVFPCVDEPDSKVPWQLTLDVPKDLVAVSNTPETATTQLDGKTKRVEFAQTKPLPSYLVAFGVGPFDIVDAGKTKSGVPVRMVTLKGRGAETAWLGQNTPQVIDLLEDWFGMPYPYPKLDFLTIPMTVGFGAMENVGLVTYTERGMLVDPKKPSWERRHGTVMTAAHELAHQWFGDYVTTAWWDDIWLNEGFANWMQTKIVSKLVPAWHDELAEVNMKFGALYADSVTSARRIRQPIDTQNDILNVFDGITYDKGASVLNMFEAYVGPEVFQKGVRNYLASRAFGNATSTDFVAAISSAAGKDLGPAFSSFLDQGGAPELEAHLACDRGGPRVTMTQKRYVPPGSAPPPAGKPWIFPVCIAYEKAGKRAEKCTLVEQPEAEVALDTKTCPRWIYPNAGGHGYFRMKLGTREVATLRDEAWPLLDWRERRTLFFDVSESARHHAGLPLQLALSLVPKMLIGGDRFTLPDALGLPLGFDFFVADDQRGKYESWLRTQFGPAAAQLGALPKDTDDLDAESTRNALYNAVAWMGRDPDLDKQAVELSASWRDLPQAVRGNILRVAVDTSPEVFSRVLSELKTEKVQRLRNEMIGALGSVRDPKRREQALQLLLDPAVDIRETMWILFSAPNEANRQVAEKFFREHEKELVARMPQDEVTGGIGRMAFVFTGSCDAHRRDDVADYVTKHFAPLPGGDRIVKNAIEGMDQCIAMRASLEPEIRAWLGGWKPPAKKDKDKTKSAPSPAGSDRHSRRSGH